MTSKTLIIAMEAAFTLMLGGVASAQDSVSLPTQPAARTHVPMRERFAELDVNRDGALTLTEIGDRDPHMAKHFQQIDANGDGRINGDELREYKRQKHAEKMSRQSSSQQQAEPQR